MADIAISHIIEQHAEESAFLWFLRNRAVQSPQYTLASLSRLDNRVEAHLDGLRVAGNEGWAPCLEAVSEGESAAVFPLALLALERKDLTQLADLLVLAEASQPAQKALLSAMGWVQPQQLSGVVKALFESTNPFHQTMGLAACSIHRVDPGIFLEKVIRNSALSPLLRCRALRIFGEIKRTDEHYWLRDGFTDDEPLVRYWSAWSSVMLGQRGEALELLKQFVVLGSEFPDPMPLLMRTLSVEAANDCLRRLAQEPQNQRALISYTGMTGNPQYLPWLLQQMAVPELSRIAGEAFSLIAGTDLSSPELEGVCPEGFRMGGNEEPEDDDVSMDIDGDLPWPNQDALQRWWQAKAHQFQPGYRYLLGLPITEANCQQVLRSGYQRQRAAAALELALINKKTALFSVKAPGGRQQQLLAN